MSNLFFSASAMRPSRRKFLNAAGVTLMGALLRPLSALGKLPENIPAARQRHRLLFDDADIGRIRETAKHPRFASYWQAITSADLDADRKFLLYDLKLNNHVADLLKARTILERTSFLYAVTQDQKQLDIAKLAIDRILQYKKWDYFLEGGKQTIGLQRAPETTIAMSFAREWLDDVLSAELKEEIENQIAEKGAPPCYRTLYGMKYPDRVRGWGFDPESDYKFRFNLSRWPLILNSTNLKVIPIAGLGIAACLLHGKHPEAKRWLNMALQSAKAFAPMFGSDGSYDEGVSYWGYTALHLTLFLEALHRTIGDDEHSLINYPGTIRYGLEMSMPTINKPDDCVNFGDASTVGDVSVAAWVARNHRDPVAQFVATAIGGVKTQYGLVWFDPSVEVKIAGAELYDVRFVNDWIVSRTGWNEQSSVVALRSGGPGNHEHADRNSVIFKAYGERLLHDPLKAAYSYTLPHWILRLTEAHNAVLINGKGHQYHDGHEGTNASWAEATVVEYRPSTEHLIVTSDATEAYRLVHPDVDLVRRTVIFLKPDILLIYDRVRLKSIRSNVQVRFQVYNEDGAGTAETNDMTFFIKRPQASLRGTIISSSPCQLRSGAHAVPKEIGVYPYIEADASEALDHRILAICTAQRRGKEHGSVSFAKKDVWTVKVEHNGQLKTVSVNVGEAIPKVSIS
jgi:hypothetical protein